MLEGCGHDIGSYREMHGNFYRDVVQHVRKKPEEQVESPAALVPTRGAL